ncbi:MAG: DUF308 domain-containing protein [Bacteroidales bacterium]|jgi:uncharacterized membrane protein HdeD (DUF308 family)
MENQIIKTGKNAIKHWYLSLILGIIFIFVGIWVLMTPVSSYFTLSILFSVTIFVSGISEIIYSITNRKEISNWGWVLAGGIIDLLFGLWLIASPLLSIAILPFVVAFILMFRSMMGIGFAFDLKDFAGSGWGWLLTLGILGLLFSFILLWNPVFAGLTTVICTGCAFITLGFFRIILSFKLQHLHKLSKRLSEF